MTIKKQPAVIAGPVLGHVVTCFTVNCRTQPLHKGTYEGAHYSFWLHVSLGLHRDSAERSTCTAICTLFVRFITHSSCPLCHSRLWPWLKYHDCEADWPLNTSGQCWQFHHVKKKIKLFPRPENSWEKYLHAMKKQKKKKKKLHISELHQTPYYLPWLNGKWNPLLRILICT